MAGLLLRRTNFEIPLDGEIVSQIRFKCPNISGTPGKPYRNAVFGEIFD
jgi:hypothetical protein